MTIVCSDLQPEEVKIHSSDIINNVYIHFYIVRYNPIHGQPPVGVLNAMATGADPSRRGVKDQQSY